MKVAVIGVGLIGGSLAMDLRKRGFADHFIGVTRSEKSAKKLWNWGWWKR